MAKEIRMSSDMIELAIANAKAEYLSSRKALQEHIKHARLPWNNAVLTLLQISTTYQEVRKAFLLSPKGSESRWLAYRKLTEVASTDYELLDCDRLSKLRGICPSQEFKKRLG